MIDKITSTKQVDLIANQVKQKASLPKIETDPTKNLVGLLNPVKVSGGFSNQTYESVYRRDSEGRLHKEFDNYDYNKSYDQNVEALAQNQSTGEKWKNGLVKFLGKTGTAVIGGTVGTVNGLFEAMNSGNLSSIYDNTLNDRLNDVNEKMSYNLPNYWTQADKDKSLIGQLGTANFWADDFLGGLSFTAGAIVSEGIWATTTGGTSLATSFSRVGAQLASKSAMKSMLKGTLGKEALKRAVTTGTQFGKAGETLNTLRYVMTSAGYEASVEANHYMKDMRDGFYDDFLKKNGRAPEAADYDRFNSNLVDGANAVFGMNALIVGTGNLAVIGKINGLKAPSFGLKEATNKALFGVGLDKTGKAVIQANRAQKIAGGVYSFTRPMVVEGVWEEGGQSVVSNAFSNYVKSTYDPKYTSGSMDMVEAFMEGMEETFTTKEGFKEVMIGMITGLVAGKGSNLIAKQGFSELKGAKDLVEAQSKFNRSFGSDKISETLLNTASQSFVTSTTNDVLTQNLMNANRIQASTEMEQVSGDFISSQQAKQQGVISQLAMAYNLEQLDDVVSDTVLALETKSVQDIAVEQGISEEQASKFREELISEYKNTAKEYKQNRDFVELYYGAEMKNMSGVSASVMKDAIAYVMTAGKESYNQSLNLLKGIKQDLSSVYEIDTTLNVIEQLNSITEEGKAKIETLKKELNSKNKEISSINNQILQAQKSDSEATNLNKLSAELAQAQKESTELENKVNSILKTEKVFTQEFGDNSTFVTKEQLLGIDEAFEDLMSNIELLKRTDAVKGQEIASKVDAYNKSIQAFREFNMVNRDIAEGATNFSKRKSIFAKLTRSAKLNEREVEFMDALAQRLTENKNHEDVIQAVTNEINRRKEELINEVPVEVVEHVATTLTAFESLVANNPYLQGRFTQEQLEQAFNNAELEERYLDLLIKAMDGNDSMLLEEALVSDKLSEEEAQELQDLVNTLSVLEIAEGFTNESITLRDLLTQASQLRESNNLVSEESQGITSDTFAEMTSDDFGSPANTTQEDVTNTAYGVQVSERNGITTVHNITLPTLLEGLNYTSISRIDSTGKSKKIDGDVSSDKGEKVKITFADGKTLILEVTPKRSIKITSTLGETVMDILNQNSNYRRIKYRNTKGHGYAFLYENGEMLQTDFTTNERYNYESIYDLNQDENLYFEVDMNDPYNQMLKDTNDPQAESLVKIYVTNDKGEVVGEIKASDIDNSSEFLSLREEAFEVFQKGGGILKYQAPVKKVFLGVPNLTLNDEGFPQSVPFGVENVVDFGHMENGTLNLKNGTEDVKTDFVSKLKDRKSVAVVIFKRGNQLIAFPVDVIATEANQGDFYKEVFEIDNTDTAKKVIELNDLLLKNNIKTDLYFSSPQDQNIYNQDGSLSENFLNAIEGLNKVKEKPNLLGFEISDLPSVVQSAIDFDNNPIVSPKIKMNLKEMVEAQRESITVETVEEQPQEVITQEVFKKVEKTIKEVVEKPKPKVEKPTLANETQRKKWNNSRGDRMLPNSAKDTRGADPELTYLAEEYARRNGIEYNRQTEYVKVDVERAKRIAQAYEEMEHNPNDPVVKEAYQNLIRQTMAQYEMLIEAGYQPYFFDETNDPYDGNPAKAMKDLTENKVMGSFSTASGFGSNEEMDVSDNPMLADTGLTWGWGSLTGEQRPVLANDVFRFVHDAFGHGLEGAGFRARGEENAWQAHARLFTGSAVGAITSETRGQNSWLNYGKHGEQNRTASVEDTIFADQKTGLMPEWTWQEGFDNSPKKQELPSLTEGEVMNESNSKHFLKSNVFSLVTKNNYPPTITLDAISSDNSFLDKVNQEEMKDIILMEYDAISGTGSIRTRVNGKLKVISNVKFKRPQDYKGGALENPTGDFKTKDVLRFGVEMDMKENRVEFDVPAYSSNSDINSELWDFTYDELLQEDDIILIPNKPSLILKFKKGKVINSDTKQPFGTTKRPDFKDGIKVIRARDNKLSLTAIDALRIDNSLAEKANSEQIKECN